MGAAQRHDRGAAHVLQPLGHDRIVVAIDHDLEAVLDQDLRGTKGLRHVGVERLLIAEHFELDQGPATGLAREPQRADGILAGEAAGSVGQVRVALGIDVIDQHRRVAIGHVHPAHRDRDDLGAGGVQCRGGLLEVAILAGADDQPRAEAPARDLPTVVVRRHRRRVGTAADEVHDLEPVAGGDGGLVVGAPRHDLKITLDRDLARIEAEPHHDAMDRLGLLELAKFAVNLHLHGCAFRTRAVIRRSAAASLGVLVRSMAISTGTAASNARIEARVPAVLDQL